ncbi:spinster family MFS transporter [Granulicella tundricola]|uniref:Major facilitator superfamily MFS_1 n=1 Tax=Granulicella tundricola (strain ATCC BAA-1859 / DSM 23138 / MP5ACTX9) TaxID=1198114 RepID=E8WYV8_GRATM|nr:MFS transporter [Granulicella tundricola]ADW68794.1 major facilitator superfamily MFS_1 [Granulicella tundricola MP5ACTX9]
MTTSAEVKTRPTPNVVGATTALVLLTALNFVNYIDRYILPGVQEQVKGEFHISDGQIGSLTLWFMIAYMAASPITGWLGDRFPRKPMIVVAALFWSGINLLTATVHSYGSLNIRHAALGIGEASFGIFAPAMLADFYPEDQRNRVLTIFNIAVPVGAALGYLIGGTVGEHFGWRMSFTVSAVPGIIIALLIAFFMKEPERAGSKDDKAKVEKGTVLSLVKNPAYLCSILGYAAVTFTLGGISWWMPSFLQRVDGRSMSSAGFIMGAITVVTGLLGTICGGVVAQRWSKKNPAALYLVPMWGALLAFPPAMCCFFGPKALILPSLALAIFLIFLGSGPVNAATVNAVQPNVRATALAGQLLMIHLLGDAPSPRIIGVVSDHSNLAMGLGSTLVTLLIAAVIFFIGSRYAKPLQHEVA